MLIVYGSVCCHLLSSCRQDNRIRYATHLFFFAIILFLTGCSVGPTTDSQLPATPADSISSTITVPDGRVSGPITLAEEPSSTRGPQHIIERGTGIFINPESFQNDNVASTDGNEVTIDFVDADLRDVVRMVLGDILNLNYAVSPDVGGTITIQLAQPIPRSAVLDVFERALRLIGVTVIARGGLFEVVPSEVAMQVGAGVHFRHRASEWMPGFGIEIVQLEFISAQELHKILVPFISDDTIVEINTERNLLIVAGTRAQRMNISNLARLFDVDWLQGQSVALFPLQFASAEAIADELRLIFGAGEMGALTGVVRFNAVKRLNAILVVSTQPQHLDRIAEWIKRLDQGLGETSPQAFVYYVQNGRAADLAHVLAGIFAPQGGRADRRERFGEVAPGRRPITIAGEVRSRHTELLAEGGLTEIEPLAADPVVEGVLPGEAEVRIIPDEATNALVILATPRNYQRIEAVLRKLDVVPLQVLIEATVAEVTLNDNLEYGLQWFFESGNFAIRLSETQGSIDPVTPGFSAVFGPNNARAVLSALASITDLNVISAPQVLVLDNQTAVLQVGDQVPVPVQQVVPVEAAERVVNTIEFRDTGTILLVTPRVNASGLVTLEVQQEVSDAVRTVTSGIDAPTIQRRLIETTVAVGSGETLALGGLIRDRSTKNRSGVPLLMEIPILGNLFRRTADATQRTEILVLITPRVVRNAEDARAVTNELRQRLRALAPLESKLVHQ